MIRRPVDVPLSRRGFIRAAGGFGVACGFGFLAAPASAASARDPRFVVIILRGAMDGLSAVPPVGDPDYATLHGDLAFAASGDRAALPLDSGFGLHPSLAAFKTLYDLKQAMVVHAVATSYRDRSHFDGQDVLESGNPGPGRTDSGWLNRTLAALPGPAKGAIRGLGVGATAPLVIRGPAPALGWAPPGGLAPAGADLTQRVLDLYAHSDAVLGERLHAAVAAEKVAAEGGGEPGSTKKPGGGPVDQMRAAAAGAGRLLATPGGPRLAALAFDGFDTHQNEGAAQGLLAQRLQGLDASFEALHASLGEAWKDTIVIAVTEFGRTVRVNGTHGTDHGTATAALLAGGALAGGRVVADWPSLRPERLYEGRDLYPTADLRGVIKGLIAEPFGLSAKALAETVFPDSAQVAPTRGLIV
ncbi:uncharacterized protein (DUF1501 family) [Roseiarcus fermentans]|uniref:Uncharacterized protein (DUF1501 family) n=2 Tax=Roseiarcus fermentans TaxID=1473586 RepID=A0A366FV45_9HYPH|nr:uncharacterized protein (DUF1501 family) [Roseiarcus fermentans]